MTTSRLQSAIHATLCRGYRARVLGLSLIGLTIATVVVYLSMRKPVTLNEFGKIHVGMSQGELRQILGSPEYEVVEYGLVDAPDSFTTNRFQSKETLRQRGFRNYRRQQWSSRELTIIVISDPEGPVVSRYTAGGQSRNLLSIWFSVARRWLGW